MQTHGHEAEVGCAVTPLLLSRWMCTTPRSIGIGATVPPPVLNLSLGFIKQWHIRRMLALVFLADAVRLKFPL